MCSRHIDRALRQIKGDLSDLRTKISECLRIDAGSSVIAADPDRQLRRNRTVLRSGDRQIACAKNAVACSFHIIIFVLVDPIDQRFVLCHVHHVNGHIRAVRQHNIEIRIGENTRHDAAQLGIAIGNGDIAAQRQRPAGHIVVRIAAAHFTAPADVSFSLIDLYAVNAQPLNTAPLRDNNAVDRRSGCIFRCSRGACPHTIVRARRKTDESRAGLPALGGYITGVCCAQRVFHHLSARISARHCKRIQRNAERRDRCRLGASGYACAGLHAKNRTHITVTAVHDRIVTRKIRTVRRFSCRQRRADRHITRRLAHGCGVCRIAAPRLKHAGKACFW